MLPLFLASMLMAMPGVLMQAPAADAPASTHAFTGAALSATLPDEWIGYETSNGQIFQAHLADQSFPLNLSLTQPQVRLMVVPGQPVSEAAFRTMVEAEFMKQMAPTERVASAPTTVTRQLMGAERQGQHWNWRKQPEHDGIHYQGELYVWNTGVALMAMWALDISDEQGHFNQVTAILDSCQPQPFDPQGTREIVLGEHRFRMPVMVPCELMRQPDNTTWRFAGPAGSLEVTRVWGSSMASTAMVKQLRSQQRQQLQSIALSVPRDIQRWVGSGMVKGLQVDMPSGQGQEKLDLRRYFIPGDHDALIVSQVVAQEANRQGVEGVTRLFWQSLELAGPPSSLARQEARGLTMLLPPDLDFLTNQATQGDWQAELGPPGAPLVVIERLAAAPADAEAYLRKALTKQVEAEGGTEVGEIQAVGGSLLGHQGGLATVYQKNGQGVERYLFGAPLQDGFLSVSLRSSSEDAEDNLSLFSALLSQLAEVPTGSRRVDMEQVSFSYPGGKWRLALLPQQASPFYHARLEGPEGAVVLVRVRAIRLDRGFVGLGGGTVDMDPLTHLASLVLEQLSDAIQRDKKAGWAVAETCGGSRDMASGLALWRRYRREVEGYAQWVTEMAFGTAEDLIEIEAVVPEQQESSLEEVEAILASLRPAQAMSHDSLGPQVVDAAGLRLHLPPGYRLDLPEEAAAGPWLIRPAGLDTPTLRLDRATAAEGKGVPVVVGGLDLRYRFLGEGPGLEAAMPDFRAILASLEATP